MTGYQTWYELESLSELNAHLQYLRSTMRNDSCLFISFLDQIVEIPIYKREFKTKPTEIAPLVRTSSVGRAELANLRDSLSADGYRLRERRSPKKKYLNQVSVRLSTEDDLFPSHVKKILSAIADVKGEVMPDAMIVGYFAVDFSPSLPGQWHADSSFHSTIFKIGKKIGRTFK